MASPGHSGTEDSTDDDAADGILVVQVRRLRAIPGEVSEREARQAKLSGLWQARQIGHRAAADGVRKPTF